jgi:hypothetical protein
LDTSNDSFVLALIQLQATEFSNIASDTLADGRDVAEITYRVESAEFTIRLVVQDPLILLADAQWASAGNSGSFQLDDDSLATLTKTFCTHDLFVLIKRYQFLLNSSQRDESLNEFFIKDRRSNPTRIEFYPLMNLVTAYYESH